MLISVITTTYNNSHEIEKLFHTLEKQSEFNFEWIIIDDGSASREQPILKEIQSARAPFEIKLYHQSNQGKHIALNCAFAKVKGDVTIIIDADDRPLPDMIKTINDYWTPSRLADNQLAIITFERGKNINSPLLGLPVKCVRANYTKYRYQNSLYGDYAETFKSSVLKQYRFPQYANEKFLSEDYVENDLGSKYDSIFVDHIIYLAAYRPEGLTKNIRKIEWDSPQGTFATCKRKVNNMYLSPKMQIKFLIKYCLFGFRNKISLSEQLAYVDHKILYVLCLPVSLLIYLTFLVRFGR